MNVSERINRILFIMSLVSQNQGMPVAELARQVGLRPRQLIKELEFMLLIGKPPFRPDDYIDIYVEEGLVYIEFDQMLNRPLRLTRPEAMALLLSLQLLDAAVDPEGVKSLKTKIEQLISESADPSAHLQDRILLESPSQPVSEHFSLLRKAIQDRRKVKIDYYSLTRDQTATRVVRPYFLMKYLGYWYLTGHCEARRDLRTFKFERILSVVPVPEKFPPIENVEIEQCKQNFLKSMGQQPIEIYFEAVAAPWIIEQWGESVRQADDGGVILTLLSETLEFPSRLILRHAPHARPLSPPELVEKVRTDARKVAEMYDRRVLT
jgi:proteasome accessory factor C